MKKFIFNFVFIFFSLLKPLYKAQASQIEFYSTNPDTRDDCKLNLLPKILSSPDETTIHILMYSLTNLDIINGLKRVAREGKKICIVVDYNQYFYNKDKSWSMYQNLVKLEAEYPDKIKIRTLGKPKGVGITPSPHNTLHDKMAIIKQGKDYTMVTGSYNWTQYASKHNYEQCLFLKNGDNEFINNVINQGKTRFNTLWEVSNPLPERSLHQTGKPDIKIPKGSLDAPEDCKISSSPQISMEKRGSVSLVGYGRRGGVIRAPSPVRTPSKDSRKRGAPISTPSKYSRKRGPHERLPKSGVRAVTPIRTGLKNDSISPNK